MLPQPRVSRAGIELVKRFEGLRRKAARLAGGGWTIGYGHTRSAREGAVVTPEQAEALLTYDLRKVADAILPQIYTPLTQNQFDALCAFAFNIGLDNFASSSVLKRLNEGAHLQAAAALELWRKAQFAGEDLVIDALVRRRAAEKALFLTPQDGFRPSPTPVLRVLLDPSVIETLEQRRSSLAHPAVLTASLEGDTAIVEREPPPFELTPDDAPAVSSGASDEQTSDGEPSAALAAAANVRARLERLFADDAPPADPRTDLSMPEPPVALHAAPVVAPESRIEVHVQPELAPASPEPETRVQLAPVAPTPLFDPFAPRPALDESEPGTAPEHTTSAFGRRARPVQYTAYPRSSPSPRRAHTAYGAPMLILALVGVAMFAGSIVAMLGGKVTFAQFCIGIVGVVCMAPAAIRFLLNQIEPEPVKPVAE